MDLLAHLRGFVAVADHLNVSRAAEELGIDQPLLSRRLRNLETRLGVQLLDRSHRRIELTESGRQLAPRARALLDQADHLLGSVTRIDPQTFTIGLPPEADPAAVARLMTALDAENPGIRAAPTTVPAGSSADRPAAGATGRSGPTTGGPPKAVGRRAGWWIEPSSPEEGRWTTPLGVARVGADPDPAGSDRFTDRAAGADPVTDRAGIRLGDLRPRRGRRGPAVLILEEDEVVGRATRFREEADRCGLGPALLRTAPAVVARAEVLAGRALMICSARQAERDGLAWTPILDEPLRRWYRLVEVPPIPPPLRTGPLRRRMLQLVAASVDATQATDGAASGWWPT